MLKLDIVYARLYPICLPTLPKKASTSYRGVLQPSQPKKSIFEYMQQKLRIINMLGEVTIP